jgi:hypothetical protein
LTDAARRASAVPPPGTTPISSAGP